MITHPDTEVQSIIETLEGQRDAACVLAAQKSKQCTEAVNALVEANKRIAELEEVIQAAAQAQVSNVIDLHPEVIPGEAAHA